MKITRNACRNKPEKSYWANQIFAESQQQRQDSNTKTSFTHLNTYRKVDDRQGYSRLFQSLDDRLRIPQMLIKSGQTVLRTITLDKLRSEIVLGSHELSDMQLNTGGVSEFHARVFRSAGRYFIEDLFSQHGTFLNGEKLRPGKATELGASSVVKIHNFEIYFKFDKPRVLNHTTEPKLQEFGSQNSSDDYLQSQLINHRKQIKSWSDSETELSVIGIVDETETVKTFRLAGQKSLLFQYQPGQYITLIIDIDGRIIKRSYSISSTPSRPYVIEITVKRVPGGLVSNWLCDQVCVGDVFKTKGPFGRFSCLNYPSRKIIFLAAGSGIAPIMSMIRWITDTEADIDVMLLMSFRNPDDVIFAKELELLAARSKNFKGYTTLTSISINNASWKGFVGRINKSMISQIAPDLMARHVYLCGPEPFMDQARGILQQMSFPRENLHCESFSYTDQMTVNKKSQIKHKILEKNGKYSVLFKKSGQSATTDGDVNLLEIARAFDLPLDYDCCKGTCGACMVKCLSGDIEMPDEADIDQTDRKSGWIYSCCAYPKSDIVLDC